MKTLEALNSKNHANLKIVPMDSSGGDFCVSLLYDDGSPVDWKDIGKKVMVRLQESDNSQEAQRVLDIILLQNAAKHRPQIFCDLGRGFHSSFRGTQGGLSLNIGPWKRKTLADFGILTQCISPLRVNDQYLTNVVLKMNAKISRMEALPPPSPLPLNSKHAKLKLVPMDSSGFPRRGQHITLLTNHFKVAAGSVDGDFYHYNVALSYDDSSPVDCKGIEKKVTDMLRETYDTEHAGKDFVYKSLFTVDPLQRNKLEFTVFLEDLSSNKDTVNGSPVNKSYPEEGDRKRIRRPLQSKSFKVEIAYAAKIPMRAIANALRGQESENYQEALRVLDIILRQIAAKQGSLVVRQSIVHNRPQNFCDLGGGVLGCRVFHSSFMAAQGGLLQKTDVSEAGMNISSKALSTLQRSSLVKKSRPNPQERMSDLSDVLVSNNYGVNPLLYSSEVSISSSFTEVVDDLYAVVEENPQARCAPTLARVEEMFEQVKTKLPQIPPILLCLIPERKTSTIYGPWERKAFADSGIVTQCISPLRVNNQYLSNVALKGTGIALIIYNGFIVGTGEGRAIRDVETEKKKKKEEEDAMKEASIEMKIPEEAAAAIVQGSIEEEEDTNIGEITRSSQLKFSKLGRSILVATTGANVCFDVVCGDLKALCGEDEVVKIEDAVDICCSSIQNLLITRDFDATLSLCGFWKEGPVIISFKEMKQGDVCKNEMKVVKKELEVVALGSGKGSILSHLSRCDLADPDLTLSTLLPSLEAAVAACGVEDGNCGGFLSVAFVDSEPSIDIMNTRHSLVALAEHYKDMKDLWSTRFLYMCQGHPYNLNFEECFEKTLRKTLYDAEFDVEFSTHVLGVKSNTLETVGIISFPDAQIMKNAFEIVTNSKWAEYINFCEASVEILEYIASMFSCGDRDRDFYL